MNMQSIKPRRVLLALLFTGLAASAAMAFGDCARSPHGADVMSQAAAEPRAESAVSMSDPALDGLFARYAGLHRDAVGYALTDVVQSPLYAKAVPDTAAPITR